MKLKKFLDKPFPDKLNAVHAMWRRLIGIVYYRHIFASFGRGSVLFRPLMLSNTQCVHIGRNVTIRAGARIEAVVLDPANPPQLHIGDNVIIEQNAHIVFLGKVEIHDGVGIAPNCTILCASHPFFDVHDPVLVRERVAGQNAVIEIGPGSLIGAGTAILLNVRLGKYVIVGANSVVKKNVRDYTVVNGNPAVPALQFDPTEDRWRVLEPSAV